MNSSAELTAHSLPAVAFAEYASTSLFRPPDKIYCELGHALAARAQAQADDGKVEKAQKLYGEASYAFQEALRWSPDSAALHFYTAQVRQQLGRSAAALQSYIEATACAPQLATLILPHAHHLLTPDLARELPDPVQRWQALLNEASGGAEPIANWAALHSFTGRVHLYKGQYQTAADHYRQALQAGDESVYAFEGLGEALWGLANATHQDPILAEAAKHLQQAVEIAALRGDDRRRAKTRLKLGRILIKQARYDEARATIEAGLNLDLNLDADLHVALGDCLLGQGQAETALAHAEQAIAGAQGQATRLDALILRAAAHLALENWSEAAEAARAAQDVDITRLEAVCIRAEALVRGQADVEQGVRLLQYYLRERPGDVTAHRLLIDTMEERNYPAAAIAGAIQVAMRVAPPEEQARLAQALARHHVDARRPASAILALAGLAPASAQGMQAEREQLLAAAGQLSAAESLDALQDRPDDIVAALNVLAARGLLDPSPVWQRIEGDALARLGRAADALKSYELGLSQAPDDSVLLERRAALLDETENAPAAAAAWRQVVQQKPDSAPDLVRLAKACYRAGAYEDALAAVEKAMAPTTSGAIDAIQCLELKAGILTALQRPAQEVAAAYRQAGEQSQWKAEWEASIVLLRKSLALDATFAATYWMLAEGLSMRASALNQPTERTQREALWREALANWEKGAAQTLPDADNAWAYLTRALLTEIPLPSPEAGTAATLAWQAVAFTERALLRGPAAYRFAFAARFHRTLGNLDNVRVALEQAEEWNANDTQVLVEQLIDRANAGDGERAQRLVAQYRSQDPGVWVDGVEAFVLGQEEQYQQAINILDRLVVKVPSDEWYHQQRALCQAQLGHTESALESCRVIRHLPGIREDKSRQGIYAWASFLTSLFDPQQADLAAEGRSIWQSLLDDPYRTDPTADDYVRRLLGQCLLTLNEVDAGRELLFMGIEGVTNQRELRELLLFDFVVLQRQLPTRPGMTEAQLAAVDAVLTEARSQINQRLEQAPVSPDPEAELTAVLSAYDDNRIEWPWLGAQASLGRLFAHRKRWAEAAEAFRRLGGVSQAAGGAVPLFPEYRQGLSLAVEQMQAEASQLEEQGELGSAAQKYSSALSYLKPLGDIEKQRILVQRLGDLLLRSEHLKEALGSYEELLRLAADPAQQIEAKARLALVCFQLGDHTQFRSFVHDVLDQLVSSDAGHPGRQLGEVCQGLLPDSDVYWRLDAEFARWLADGQTAPELRGALAEARQGLTGYLSRQYRMDPAAATWLPPAVTPLAVEIGAGLLALLPADIPYQEWPLFKQHIPAMRERLEAATGVSAPGLRLRGNEADLPANSYIISLDEVPLVLGSVDLDRAYCLAPAERLIELGVPPEARQEARRPLTGEAGYWIAQDHWSAVEAASIELWTDPFLYVLDHVDAVLRSRLGDLVGITEVEYLTDTWSRETDGAALIKAALPDPTARRRFARLLRALVAEGVPLVNWRAILQSVIDSGLPHDDLHEPLAAVRLALRAQLPGNAPPARHVSLPAELEKTIETWLERQNGKRFLAIAPEDTQEFLAGVRSLVDGARRDQVLVVRSSELRPFVRRVVELEFPYLMVLAEQEVL